MFRANIETFEGPDGKIRERLKSIEGQVSSTTSSRKVGSVITDFAANKITQARGFNTEPWYEEIFKDPERNGTYQKSHLIAARLGGPTHSYNMAPLRWHVNQNNSEDGRWYSIEERISAKLEKEDLVRTESGFIVRRADLSETERSSGVETLKLATGNLRVVLPYSNHDLEHSLVPLSFNADFSMFDSKKGEITHATNNELTEQGRAAVAQKKEDKRANKGSDEPTRRT